MKKSAAASDTRDPGLESLRGLLILCVVLGHLPLDRYFAGREGGLAAALWAWLPPVYHFHVPAFLALSCLFVPAWDWRWMGKRALLLLLPYLFWLAKPTVFFDPIGDLHRLYEAQKTFSCASWACLGSVLWFLPALLACNAVTALLLRLPRAWGWGAALTGFALLRWQVDKVAGLHAAGLVPWSLDVAVYYAPVFLAARELYSRRSQLARVKVWQWLVVFGLGVAMVQAFEPVKTHNAFGYRVDLAQFAVPVSALGLLGATAAVLALIAAFTGLQGWAWLAWIGKRSLPIYLMHWYFLIMLWEKLKAYPGLYQSEAALIALPALIMAAAILLSGGISWAARKLSPYAKYIGMEA